MARKNVNVTNQTILNRDLVWDNCEEGKSLFSTKILEGKIVYPVCEYYERLSSNESNEHINHNSKFQILDFLPCPCKIPNKKYRLANF